MPGLRSAESYRTWADLRDVLFEVVSVRITLLNPLSHGSFGRLLGYPRKPPEPSVCSFCSRRAHESCFLDVAFFFTDLTT